tara:strand:+ start:10546 stop:11163 length:618 start_codon:yes stop_codon:yes gene_type:complete
MENNIYKKIFDLQSEIGVISKDAKNKFFQSQYFDINSLIKQLHPLLIKNKLVLIQPCVDGTVKSIISDMDGNSIESSLQLPTGLDAQKIGSAITYYRRYTLTSLLSLQAEDDDGNSASSRSSSAKPANDFFNKKKTPAVEPVNVPAESSVKLSPKEIKALIPEMKEHIRKGKDTKERGQRFQDIKDKYSNHIGAIELAKMEAASK